jgi:hypothetical protein
VYLLSLANVVGAIVAPFGSNVLPVHKLLIVGQFVMSVFLGLVVIFSVVNIPTLVLVMIILMILAYQLSMGSYYFVYVSQVTNATQNSVAVFSLWTAVLIISLVTKLMINGLQISGTFTLFCVCTFVGGFYFIVAMKSTKGLSSEQCKQLYFPDDLKNDTKTQEFKESLLTEDHDYGVGATVIDTT